jgi:hypothetical protein
MPVCTAAVSDGGPAGYKSQASRHPWPGTATGVGVVVHEGRQ